ncbi:MAG: hypothetical protein FWD16_06515 [Clostridia bacterium]|nr:hypothetical protein [Clostridia bacterium]
MADISRFALRHLQVGAGLRGLWQTLLLYKWRPLFAWLPIETIIKERQQKYYDTLGVCDNASDSGAFIDFLLRAMVIKIIHFDSLRNLLRCLCFPSRNRFSSILSKRTESQ